MKLVLHDGEHGSATLSADKKYRYRLTRRWGDGQGIRIVWIMLNPSTANHEANDPTITRCIGFSKRLGASSLVVVNLFAYRTTNPKELLRVEDPAGPNNMEALLSAAQCSDEAVAAWGEIPRRVFERAHEAISAVRAMRLKCLGTTKGGAPRHPVRLPYAVKLEPWS